MRLWGLSPVDVVFRGQVIWIKEMRREDILVRVEGWELHCFNLQEPRGNGFLAGQGINIKYLDWDEAGSSLTQRERKGCLAGFFRPSGFYRPRGSKNLDSR